MTQTSCVPHLNLADFLIIQKLAKGIFSFSPFLLLFPSSPLPTLLLQQKRKALITRYKALDLWAEQLSSSNAEEMAREMPAEAGAKRMLCGQWGRRLKDLPQECGVSPQAKQDQLAQIIRGTWFISFVWVDGEECQGLLSAYSRPSGPLCDARSVRHRTEVTVLMLFSHRKAQWIRKEAH